MRIISIALTGVVQRIIPKDPVVQRAASFQTAFFQVRSTAANPVYLGDASLTSANGLQLLPGAPYQFPTPQGYTESLNEWYVLGTAGDALNILVIE